MPGSAMARADRAWTAPTELFEPGVTQMYHLLTQLAVQGTPVSATSGYGDNTLYTLRNKRSRGNVKR